MLRFQETENVEFSRNVAFLATFGNVAFFATGPSSTYNEEINLTFTMVSPLGAYLNSFLGSISSALASLAASSSGDCHGVSSDGMRNLTVAPARKHCHTGTGHENAAEEAGPADMRGDSTEGELGTGDVLLSACIAIALATADRDCVADRYLEQRGGIYNWGRNIRNIMG